MPLRRLFLLSAATLVSVAALLAIGTVLSGDFGDTEGKLFATIGAAFVGVATAAAGAALLERGVSRPLGIAGLVLAGGGFVLWTEQVWARHDSESYWKLLWILLTWALATLVVSSARLITRSPRLLRTLFVGTAAVTVIAAIVATTMVVRESGDGWQLFAVALILALLGQILTPILERYSVTPGEEGAPRERVLGTVPGLVVVAVRVGAGQRRVRIGRSDVALEDDETVLVRPA